MKNVWIPLAVVILLAAASTASAGWGYVVPSTGTSFYYHGPGASVYVHRAPMVRVPTVVTPRVMVYPSQYVVRPTPYIVRPAPVVVQPTIVVPRRAVRRTHWTTWY